VEKILETGWDWLVKILDEGGYVRYDFSTATKVLNVFGNLKKEYNGDLWQIYYAAQDSKEIEERLKNLGKGIGDVTVSIFLLAAVWAYKFSGSVRNDGSKSATTKPIPRVLWYRFPKFVLGYIATSAVLSAIAFTYPCFSWREGSCSGSVIRN
jgi:hypothetical protein